MTFTAGAGAPDGGTASYVYSVTINSKPVLSNLTGKSATENTPLDIDLRTLAADDLTVDDKLAFELSRARSGSVSLLADGHTARFTPAPDYHGPASFQVVARDQSLGSRLLFLYDFEPPDVATDAKVSDLANNNRFGGLESVGSGGEYAYASSVPGLLSPYATKSISLTEATTGAARTRKTLATTDLNSNDADWSVSAWIKRVSRDTNDIGTNAFTGGVNVNSGSGTGTSATAQLSATTLTAASSIGGAGNLTLSGGIHAPGNSAGIMTVTGNYSLPATGMLQVEINGIAAGTQYDQVKVLGAASVVTLAGTLDLIAAPALATGGTFTLVDNAGTAPVSGTFANLPQAAGFHEDGQWWRISYSAGTGNDVALTRITPSPWQNWRQTGPHLHPHCREHGPHPDRASQRVAQRPVDQPRAQCRRRPVLRPRRRSHRHRISHRRDTQRHGPGSLPDVRCRPSPPLPAPLGLPPLSGAAARDSFQPQLKSAQPPGEGQVEGSLSSLPTISAIPAKVSSIRLSVRSALKKIPHSRSIGSPDTGTRTSDPSSNSRFATHGATSPTPSPIFAMPLIASMSPSTSGGLVRTPNLSKCSSTSRWVSVARA